MVLLHNLEAFFNFSKYVLIFIGCIFEGPAVMIAGGFLLKLGQFDLLPLYLCAMGGDFTADLGWYAIGRFGVRKLINRFGKFFRITPEFIEKIEAIFKKHDGKILWLAKLAAGFTIPILTVAGILHISFKRYASITFLSGTVWTLLMLLVGYLFGNIYDLIPNVFKSHFLILAAVLVVLFLIFIKQVGKKLFSKEAL